MEGNNLEEQIAKPAAWTGFRFFRCILSLCSSLSEGQVEPVNELKPGIMFCRIDFSEGGQVSRPSGEVQCTIMPLGLLEMKRGRRTIRGERPNAGRPQKTRQT